MSIEDDKERAYTNGSEQAYRAMLAECIRNLPAYEGNKVRWLLERFDIVSSLRSLCDGLGLDSNWPDDVNLSDIIGRIPR